MKAMLIRNYGSPDEFYFDETHAPIFLEDELLIKVVGSSVNPVDTAIRRGLLKRFIRPEMPAILGCDVSGVVVETGKSVKKFKKGDRVFAYTGIMHNGGYGEYASVPEKFTAMVPAGISLVEAGTVPAVGLTAWESFYIKAPLRQGMEVLINGSSGGVGVYAIQIAVYLGAKVTAVCNTDKADLVRKLGAEKIVDYREENILDNPMRYDVILDCAGKTSVSQIRKLLKPNGRLLAITGTPLQMPLIFLSNLFSQSKVVLFFVKSSGKNLESLSHLIESGTVKPVIEKMYSWKDLPQAHRHLESGGVGGKIGIAVSDEWA